MTLDIAGNKEVHLLVTGDLYHPTGRDCPVQTGHHYFERPGRLESRALRVAFWVWSYMLLSPSCITRLFTLSYG